MQTITIEQKVSRKRAPVQAGVIVKFGLDVHAAQITVCRQIDGQVPQPAQKLGWSECIEWFEAHVQAGAVVHSCYEAGPCGYGLHRRLTKLGVSRAASRVRAATIATTKTVTDRTSFLPFTFFAIFV